MTHRSAPLSYEPREPITPKYQPSTSHASPSQLEPHRISIPKYEPSSEPLSLRQPEPTRSSTHNQRPEPNQFPASRHSPTILEIHKAYINMEVYEADVSLVDEYEGEDDTPLEDRELVDPIGTQVEANLELVDLDYT